jgi:hypothetical protein
MAVGAIVARILTEYSDKGTKTALKDIGKMERQFSSFANKAAKTFGVAALAAGAFAVKIGTDSVKAAITAQAEQSRLNQILMTTGAATAEQVKALNDQAEALEAVGVVSAGNIKVTQAQLATFDLQATTIKTLTPAILDYVTAEKGATASADQFKSMTNGLAQALNGQFGALTRAGFVLDEQTKKLISNGTEAERAEAIVKVLNSTYKGFNESLRDTPEGQLQALRNSFDAIKTTIGEALLPNLMVFVDMIQKKIIPAIKEWVELNGDKLANAFRLALSYGIAFANLMFDTFSFVSSNIKVFATLGAVIVAAFFGAKVAGAVAALVTGIQAIIKVMKALRTVSLASAAATALATGGISAATGAAAFAVALGGIYVATKKFNDESDKALGGIDTLGADAKGMKFKLKDYAGGVDEVTTSTKKLTKAQQAEANAQKYLNRLKEFGIKKVASTDPITLEAIRKNQLKQQKLGISSPTISLAASAGHGNIASNTTMNGGNITVNVAGSVVSQGDLVTGIKNGLEVIYRRRGGSGYAVL